MQRMLGVSDKRRLSMATAIRILKKPKAKKEAKRFVKYGIVGVLGTIIDFGVLNFLIFVMGWSTPFGKFAANIVSTSVAIISNFICHRSWTFPESQSRRRDTQLIQFTLVSLVGLLLNTLVFYCASHYFFELFLPMAIAVQLAKATASAVILFWNFGANRLWTYRGL
ncbi:MAG: GtrA family protein [Anaerolineae bacterium]|nr:GtrA family protein [Anaerolineae bacterium]